MHLSFFYNHTKRSLISVHSFFLCAQGYIYSSFLFAGELREAYIEAVEAGRYIRMPMKYGPARVELIPGALLIGDALNTRHPVVASGMGVCTRDVELIHSMLKDTDLTDKQV